MAETKMPTAHSLEDAVNSDNSLEGYAAMNSNNEDHDEIAKIAYDLYEKRGGHHGSHEDDWHQAQQELRKRKESQPKTQSAVK